MLAGVRFEKTVWKEVLDLSRRNGLPGRLVRLGHPGPADLRLTAQIAQAADDYK